MASGQQVFARSTEKTLSYKQLKTNYANILKEHGECQNKLGKQQNHLHNAKAARKRLEKENQELKEQLSKKDSTHKEALEEVQQKLEITNTKLGDKVEAYERELEKLGIDPVSLTRIENGDPEGKENKRREMKARVDSLIANMSENVDMSESLFDQLQDILNDCKSTLAEDSAPLTT